MPLQQHCIFPAQPVRSPDSRLPNIINHMSYQVHLRNLSHLLKHSGSLRSERCPFLQQKQHQLVPGQVSLDKQASEG